MTGPSMTTAMLLARLNATNRKLKAEQKKNSGLDAFDRALISAAKLGFFALFGIVVASHAEKLRPGILNTILPPTPRRRPTPP